MQNPQTRQPFAQVGTAAQNNSIWRDGFFQCQLSQSTMCQRQVVIFTLTETVFKMLEGQQFILSYKETGGQDSVINGTKLGRFKSFPYISNVKC